MPHLRSTHSSRRHVERRIGDLLDRDVRRRECIDKLLAPRARREIALAEKRPQLFQMRRDDRLAAAAGHQREQRRDDQHRRAARTASASGFKPRRQRGDGGLLCPARHRRRRGCRKSFCRSPRMKRAWSSEFIALRSTMRLPSSSTRPRRPGSITMVASGCSRIAGAVDHRAGRQIEPRPDPASRQPPSNQTGRVAARGLLERAVGDGANTEKSNAGRRPIAAVRSDTIRIGMPGKQAAERRRDRPLRTPCGSSLR